VYLVAVVVGVSPGSVTIQLTFVSSFIDGICIGLYSGACARKGCHSRTAGG
jgi:hypothetical protein